MKVSKVKKSKMVEDGRFITFKDNNFLGQLWNDGSGELSILVKGREFFYRDDGFLKDKLDWVKEEIETREEEMKSLKQALTELSKLNPKKIFKTK